MARTSKIALAVAAALAVATVLTGSALAAASGGATGDAAQTVSALSPSSEGDNARSADAGRDGKGSWQGSAGRSRMTGPMGGFRDGSGYWTAGEILQWVAIGLIGGGAVALAVWRPWRPAREGVGTGGGAVATATPAAPATGRAPVEQTRTAPAVQAPDEPGTLAQGVETAEPPAARGPAEPAQPVLARPRHWRKHGQP